MPDQAQEQDRVLGGQLYSTGGASEVTILSGTARIVSTPWLVSPEEIGISTNRVVGKVVEVGPYPSGEELIFAIRYNNVEFRTGPGEAGREKWTPSHFYSSPGVEVCVRRFRGNKMRTTQTLMDEFGAALLLLEGFGENWHALEECLSYLDEWLPADACVLVVERAEDLLVDEPAGLPALLKTVDEAGRF